MLSSIFSRRSRINRRLLKIERLELRQLMATNIGAVRQDPASPNRLMEFFLDTEPLQGPRNVFAEIAFHYGLSRTSDGSSSFDDLAFAGDWGKLGVDQIGVTRSNAGAGATQFFLDTDRDPDAEYAFRLGQPLDVPVAGNFDGLYGDDVGVTRGQLISGVRYKKWELAYGAASAVDAFPRDDTPVQINAQFIFGLETDFARVGDFDGDGKADVAAVRRDGSTLLWIIHYAGTAGYPNDGSALSVDAIFTFGTNNPIPVVGDWDNNGNDNMGAISEVVGQPQKWSLDTNFAGGPEFELNYGFPGDQYIVGNWPDRAWDGGAGLDRSWSNQLNWSDDTVPGVTSKIAIDQPGEITIQQSTGVANIGSVFSNESVNVGGGALLVNQKSNFAAISVSGGELNARAKLNANSFSMSAGNLFVESLDPLEGTALALSGGSIVVPAGGDYAMSNPMNISNTVRYGGNGILRLTGTISGNGNLEKVGPNYLQLIGTGAYTGDTTISQSELLLGASNRIPDSSNVSIATGSTLNLAQNSETIAALSGAGSVYLGSGGGVLTTNAGSSTTFSGSITGSGGFVKSGTGSLTLSGASTFGGSAIVQLGTLIVTGSLPTANPLTIQSGATLKGTGTVGATTVAGTVAPGLSPGILRTADLSFLPSSNFQVEIGGTTPGSTSNSYDQIVVSGTVNIGTSVVLNLAQFNSFRPSLFDNFVLIANDGADAIVGNFAGLTEGTEIRNFLGTGVTAAITYRGGDGNDVAIRVINVPPTDITMTSQSVAENLPTGWIVGRLGSVAPDSSETFVYALTGTNPDNVAFEIDSLGNLRTRSVFDFETQPSYLIQVQSTDRGGLQFSRQFTINVLDITPGVEQVRINNGSASRSQLTSVTIRFDTLIDHSLLPGAFALTNIDTNNAVDVNFSATNTGLKTTVVLTFAAGTSVVTRQNQNSLADGNYRLSIIGSRIRGLDSNERMSRDFVFGGQTASSPNNDNFFRLLGDTNGDGVRNGIDLNEIIPSLFNPIGYREDLDTNGDGVINGIDLNGLIPTLFGPRRR